MTTQDVESGPPRSTASPSTATPCVEVDPSWKRAVGTLVGGGVLIWLALAALGLLLTRTSLGAPLVGLDRRVSDWAGGLRNGTDNELTDYGSSAANTLTAIAVTAVVVLALLAVRHWRTAQVVLVAISGELFVFVLVTATVHRARPGVAHLDPAPPTSSFPSGHTGAAVALYVGLAVLLIGAARGRRPARSRPTRWAAYAVSAVLCVIPVVVAVSRVYRGMHYPTDVIAGALGGGTWLALTLHVLGPAAFAELRGGGPTVFAELRGGGPTEGGSPRRP